MRDVLIYDGKVEVIESKPWTTRAPAELPSWTTLLDAHEDAAFGLTGWTRRGWSRDEDWRVARYAIVAKLEELRAAVEHLREELEHPSGIVSIPGLANAWERVYAGLGVPNIQQFPRR